MSKALSTVLVGAGGYGGTYVNLLMDESMQEWVRFAAVVDPYAKSAHHYERFKDIVPVYDRLEDFYAERSAELVIISSPIHFHYEQCAVALEHGSHVLCEKPLVPTLAQYELLEQKIKSSGKSLSVGFQWCFSEVMLAIKERILAGEFGKPVCLRSFVSWPRDHRYYARGGGWAGKLKTDGGEPVNDSVASNATAHYIQHMLFMLGDSLAGSAELSGVAVECYKANQIEAFDTIAFRGEAGGAPIIYAASHATNYAVEPVMFYEFEKASIFVNVFAQDHKCVVHHRDGQVEHLGTAAGSGMKNKLLYTVQAILGGREFICTEQTVKPVTAFIDAIFGQAQFREFPADFVIKDEGRTYVKNLHLDLVRCVAMGKLPSEAGLAWAGAPVSLK